MTGREGGRLISKEQEGRDAVIDRSADHRCGDRSEDIWGGREGFIATPQS